MKKEQELKVGNRKVTVSNLDKVFYPKTGFTKGQVIDYYIQIAPVLIPHLKDRPLTMKRYPDGVEGQYFYEKEAPAYHPPWVKTIEVERHRTEGTIHFCVLNDLPSLIWAVNLADLELHTLLCRGKQAERPTSVVFDLDPGAPADVVQCAQVALLIKKMADNLKLKCFVKSSGSKGMQLYIPLNTPVTYEETTPFAKTVAETLEKVYPDLVVAKMAKELRGGKVLVDWSQNSVHKTTVSVYSLRAKERPFVSVPLTWDEVETCWKKKKATLPFFETAEALKRVKKMGDLFAEVLTLKQKLPKASSQPVETEKEKPEMEKPTKTKSKKTFDPKTYDLAAYKAKRDFKQTREPIAKKEKAKAKSELMFVIQKHAASHLHYDFRLEMEGVLKSWAVPKGPPTSLSEKRLAMHVEDHPMSYSRFEGTIPKGNYGGGTVMVWDIGTWECLGGTPTEAFRQGKIHFQLNGKKLKGEWTIVRLHDAKQENAWLLMKTGKAAKPLSTRQLETSVLTNRTMEKIATDNDAQWGSNRS